MAIATVGNTNTNPLSQQENPFEEHSQAGPSTPRRNIGTTTISTPLFNAAPGDFLEMCRTVGRLTSYIDELKDRINELEKKNAEMVKEWF